MTEAAAARGLTELSVLATLLVVVQGFVGYPLASFCLTREARRVVAGELTQVEAAVQPKAEMDNGVLKFRLPPMPEKYQTSFVLIAKTAIVAYAAVSWPMPYREYPFTPML